MICRAYLFSKCTHRLFQTSSYRNRLQIGIPTENFCGTTVRFDFKDILERLFITGLREHGFIVNRNLKIYGPLICFTSRFLHWNVASPQAINSDSLFLLSLLYPKPDVFILGMGLVAHNEHDRQLREYLHNTNIPYEILSTDLAIHAFNTINAENRFVVGAFFPLDSVRHLEAKSKQEFLANENQINDQDGILGASDVTDTHIR